ncbi:unnamed protein product, partial [Vitis vinifera]
MPHRIAGVATRLWNRRFYHICETLRRVILHFNWWNRFIWFGFYRWKIWDCRHRGAGRGRAKRRSDRRSW